MRTLRLVALSDDGKSLILADGGDDAAERFELPVDERVRTAARGEANRLTEMDAGTELPPRVIQARIRAGETPEQVAAASGTRVERIMRFAHPVIQERARIAEQAREARVRLSDGPPSVALERFVTDRLRLLDTDVEAVVWDAHRTDDGTWQVTGLWRAGDASGTTRWSFDLPSRTVGPADAATTDFAEGTRLVRVVPEVPAGFVGTVPRARAVGVVREPTGPAGHDPVHDPVHDTVVPTGLESLAHPAGDDLRDVHLPTDAGTHDLSVQALLDEVADHDTVVLARSEDRDAEDPRVHIPAWEDIVFGVRRHR